MSILTASNRIDYTADGVATTYGFPFNVYTQTDLQVYVTPTGGVAALKTLNTDYTQSAVNVPGGMSGGNVVFSSPPTNGYQITLIRKVPILQQTSFTNLDKFDAKTAIEGTYDRGVMIAQQISEVASRAPVLPVNSLLNPEFPAPGASKFIRWNSSGTALEATDITGGALNATMDAFNVVNVAGLPTPGQTGRARYVTDGMRGLYLDNGVSWNPVRGEVIFAKADFALIGDDSTDDTALLQAALDAVPSGGATVVLEGGYTYKVSSANLTLKANTHFVIQQGATLHLVGTRLTALNVNNVHIDNQGTIKSTALNTSDALPTNWDARGIVEFGGTAATPVQQVGIYGPGTIDGSFAGTPGDITILFQDKRRGVVLANVIDADVQGLNIINTVGESVWYSGSTLDRGVDISFNYIHGGNHDGISSESFENRSLHIHHNQVWGCGNGIEAMVGRIESNHVRDSVWGGGYTFAGNTPLREVSILNNVGYNNKTIDYQLEGATAPGGTVIVKDNLSIGAGTAAYSFIYITHAVVMDNVATGWGRLGAGKAFGIGGNLTTAEVMGNVCFGAGASSSGGFAVDAGTLLSWKDNYAPGVATPWTGVTPKVFTDADTTPSVAYGDVFTVTNTNPTTISMFDDGRPFQRITLIFTDGNTTISDAGNLKLNGAFTSSADDTMVLVFDGTNWYEVSRSAN